MIEKLTSTQERKLAEYREKWVKIGLSCEPLDFEKAKDAATRAYRVAGLNPPNLFLHFGSPVSAAIAAVMIKAQVGAQVWAQVRDQVGAQVGAQVWAQVYGSHDAGWLSFYNFFSEECGISDCDKLKPLIDLAQCCGWWAPYEKVCIFQDRHSVLQLDDRGMIHCEDGPAISYPDGTLDVWAINGVRVPKEVVVNPEKITTKQIEEEGNADVRQIMIDRYGPSEYMKKVGADLVDMDSRTVPGGNPRALFKMKDGSQWLVGTDGSTKRVYHMPVPEEVETCQQAHSAICGFDESRIICEG